MVALGGGSALDLGKAVAAIAGADAPAQTYALCAAPLPAARLKTICVPTTSGTGSETTRTAILSGPDGAKLWFWGDELKTDHAVLDPELTVSLPAGLTAATGIDALVHAVEAATNRNAHAANDLYAHEAIRLVSRHLDDAPCGSPETSRRARACSGARRWPASPSTIAARPSPMRSATPWRRCAPCITAGRSASRCWPPCPGSSATIPTAASRPAPPPWAATPTAQGLHRRLSTRLVRAMRPRNRRVERFRRRDPRGAGGPDRAVPRTCR